MSSLQKDQFNTTSFKYTNGRAATQHVGLRRLFNDCIASRVIPMIYSISVGIASKQPAKSKTATAGHRFEDVKKNLTRLAEEQWLSARHQETVLISEDGFPAFAALAEEEEQMLRCLGAALIIRWDTLPKKLRRELFDNAGLLGELFGLSRKM